MLSQASIDTSTTCVQINTCFDLVGICSLLPRRPRTHSSRAARDSRVIQRERVLANWPACSKILKVFSPRLILITFFTLICAARAAHRKQILGNLRRRKSPPSITPRERKREQSYFCVVPRVLLLHSRKTIY